jgi:histidyl-tRNA synthetase
VAQVQATGRAPYAMRPEFTPTLARMFAAKAGSLPKPCKWFTGGPYFRAERPQRGRLREFLQWNVDVIGLPGDLGAGGGGLNAEDAERSAEVTEAKAWMDAECVECCVLSLDLLGISNANAQIGVNDRQFIDSLLDSTWQSNLSRDQAYALLDRRAKLEESKFAEEANRLQFRLEEYDKASNNQKSRFVDALNGQIRADGRSIDEVRELIEHSPQRPLAMFARRARDAAIATWLKYDPTIVRGLAYYTGTVFEVLADGERAIAGGGRYDKLIELMGGPPTPAVGFAMGDVVVSLLLEDKGLMPQGAELMEAVSRRPASVRPEVFVVGADDESSDALVRRLSADLRRGVEADAYAQAGERRPWSGARYDAASGGVRPMHARVSYKSTRNLKKLLADGEKQFARLAAIVHGPDRVQLKDFDARKDLTPRDVGLSDAHAEFSVETSSPVYVGRAVERVLG